MSQEQTTAQITTVSPERKQMQEALQAINKKLADIKVAAESPFKTNGEFRFNPSYTSNDPIRIHRVQQLEVLIGVLGAVKAHFDKYEEAAKVLGLKTYPEFTWCGYPYEAWEHDVKVRATVISQTDYINKLNKKKKELEQFLTDEDRLAMILKDIDTIL